MKDIPLWPCIHGDSIHGDNIYGDCIHGDKNIHQRSTVEVWTSLELTSFSSVRQNLNGKPRL